ncbi:MAG TPA: VWA domain-containing protein [Candidatus Sulfotelmatobacter sp.]
MARREKPLCLLACSLVLLPSIGHGQQRKAGSQPDHFTLQSNVDVILVPVLVRNRQGAAVGDLTVKDFQVFDNKKRQDISGFMIETHARSRSTNVSENSGVASSQTRSSPRRFVVFLVDDLHITFSDLAAVREATTRVLSSLGEGEIGAILSLSGLVNTGITADHATLLEGLTRIRPQTVYHNTGTDCPDLDYYWAELIVNEHSPVALHAATDEVLNCNPGLTMRDVAERLATSAAEREFAMGEQDSRVSFAALREVVSRIAALPGLSTLILVSPGFFTLTPTAKHELSQVIDTAAVSNVTINSLDARGLYTTELNAGERGATSTQNNQLKSEYRRASMPLAENVMAALANGTGGTYVHNTNDLESGLKDLASPPEYLYLLEFHAKNLKRNGSYHVLRVTVARDGVRIYARQGYFAAKVSKQNRH